MAYSELFVCDECGSDRVLVHAEEWSPPPAGTDTGPVPYPGYGKVGGLLNRLWCPKCRAVRPYAFVVLQPPGDHPVVAYAEAQRTGCDGTEIGPCTTCGTVLIWQLDGQGCPDCGGGVFRATGAWEDGA